jgi:hypothetical protein
MWWITCPNCGHKAPLKDFEPSLADECSCPQCEEFFQVDLSDPEEDEEDEEENP